MGSGSSSELAAEEAAAAATKVGKEKKHRISTSTTTATKRGAAGLRDLGFEYRFLPCRCCHHANGAKPKDGNKEGETLAPSASSQQQHYHHHHHPRRYSNKNFCCFECSSPLFHIETGIQVTTKNRREFIPEGRFFDEVARCCSEIAVECLCQDLGLKFLPLYYYQSDREKKDIAVGALVNEDFPDNDLATDENQSSGPIVEEKDNQPTVLIITGKGKSRLGVLSVKHLLESSLEAGSALYPVHQAIERGWNVVLLDPNARGASEGMEVTRRSLDSLDLQASRNNKNKNKNNTHRPLYVLAHSAAGGHLSIYLSSGNDHQRSLLRALEGVVFTDSTHNIQWMREENDYSLKEFLQSPACLYIRNCSERPSDTFSNHRNKKAGDICVTDKDVHWKRRFGSIRTVWAGTADHSHMCWASRHVIWQFFDERHAKRESNK